MSLDIMKARAIVALIIGAGVWGLVAFLQERAVFEPTVFVILAALSFAVQTTGRGLPMRLPHRFDGSVAELRKSVGERWWVWVQAGSGLWVALQALAFGLISLVAQTFLVGLFGSTEVAQFIGTVLAVAACSFALGLLIHRLREATGIAGRFDAFKARLKADIGIDSLAKHLRESSNFALEISPSAMFVSALALGSLARAVGVQLLKTLVVGWSAFFFSWWFLLFLGAGILIAVVAPELIKRLKPYEAHRVSE
ncbi:hypothetical protein [Microbacterium sp. Leaf203]|uniref:hypothetical protein n=1 Tax=Microbacterium sp. Leaf203 TaxID=1735677 RepID=UPI0006F56C51|nr:hypothetical protein [Microbacterium sp. Leaf203]KQM36850.1 hypothetical protein ASE56_10575 [Microbacterium sp. Leaf203]